MKTWQEIEEEFRKMFPFAIIDWQKGHNTMEDILAFFKPYFQEKLHQEAKEELESTNYVQHAKNCSIYRGVLESEGLKCDCKYSNAKPESSREEEFRQKFPFSIIDWKLGENTTDKMKEIRAFIYKLEKEAYERGRNDTLAEVGRITKTELGTWAKESIGAKAVESVIEALKALKK